MRPSLMFGVAVALCACGGASAASRQAPAAVAQAPAAPPSASAAPPPASPAPATGDHTLTRSAVHGAVSQGLGVFLQRIELDDQPVRVEGKFHGFRIAALRDAKFWSGVDLKPGDVVTGVNGFSIERPEQAQTAFDSLEVANELRVTYERDGKAREIVYPIVNDR
jgi:type II secretion system protein C